MRTEKEWKMKKNTIQCTLCEYRTTYTATKLCDRCWELNERVRRDPDIAMSILYLMKQEVLDKVED